MDEKRVEARVRLVDEHVRSESLRDIDGVMRTYGGTARLEDVACGERHEGHGAVRAFYEEMFGAMPGYQMELKDRHVTGEVVIQERVVIGTHRGTWKGVPATGRRVEAPALTIFTFDVQDKLAGERIDFERATVLMQMGVPPGGGGRRAPRRRVGSVA